MLGWGGRRAGSGAAAFRRGRGTLPVSCPGRSHRLAQGKNATDVRRAGGAYNLRMPQQNGSVGSRRSRASAFTWADPVITGSIQPRCRSSHR